MKMFNKPEETASKSRKGTQEGLQTDRMLIKAPNNKEDKG